MAYTCDALPPFTLDDLIANAGGLGYTDRDSLKIMFAEHMRGNGAFVLSWCALKTSRRYYAGYQEAEFAKSADFLNAAITDDVTPSAQEMIENVRYPGSPFRVETKKAMCGYIFERIMLMKCALTLQSDDDGLCRESGAIDLESSITELEMMLYEIWQADAV